MVSVTERKYEPAIFVPLGNIFFYRMDQNKTKIRKKVTQPAMNAFVSKLR